MTIEVFESRSDSFDYLAYLNTYSSPHRSRGNATISQRRTLFREAKRRLEHGVPVSVLIRDVTRKLRAMKRGGVQ